MKSFNINKYSDNLEESMYIIGIVGLNVKDRNLLKGIIDNGVNVLRFNFVYGSENDFNEFLKMVKEIGSNIDIIFDFLGIKVRVLNKFEYIYKIYDNEEIYFCGEDKYEEIRNKINKMKMKIIFLNIKNKMLNEKEYK